MGDVLEIPLHLEDRCPLWIYTANRKLSTGDQEFLQGHFQEFSSHWKSHGREVHSFISIYEDRFLVLAADVLEGDISGCGIDASVRQITKLAASRGIEWVSAMNIAFRNGEVVDLTDRMEFRLLGQTGAITSESEVFDTSINKVGQWRAGDFVKKVGDSWHARLISKN